MSRPVHFYFTLTEDEEELCFASCDFAFYVCRENGRLNWQAEGEFSGGQEMAAQAESVIDDGQMQKIQCISPAFTTLKTQFSLYFKKNLILRARKPVSFPHFSLQETYVDPGPSQDIKRELGGSVNSHTYRINFE